MCLTTLTDRGFGLNTLQQATIVAQSMLAQYEDLAMKYAPAFIKRCSVSFAKQLLTPAQIFKFGTTDELSIDSKMKTVLSAIDKTGGSGGNPEQRAITGNHLRTHSLIHSLTHSPTHSPTPSLPSSPSLPPSLTHPSIPLLNFARRDSQDGPSTNSE